MNDGAELVLTLLANRVKSMVARQMNVAVEALTEQTHFDRQLNADDLDRIELVLEIEVEFGVRVPNQKFCEFETVGDLIEIVQAHVAGQQQSAA